MNQLQHNMIFTAVVSLLSGTAAAHPGHGDSGPLHYVQEPVHWLPIVVFSALVGLFFASLHIVRSKRLAWKSVPDDVC